MAYIQVALRLSQEMQPVPNAGAIPGGRFPVEEGHSLLMNPRVPRNKIAMLYATSDLSGIQFARRDSQRFASQSLPVCSQMPRNFVPPLTDSLNQLSSR